MTTSFRLLAVAVCASVLASCTSGPSTSGDAAATVNGAEIPREAVVEAVEELHGFSGLSAEERQELASRIEVQERETIRLHVVNHILEGILDDRGLELDNEHVQQLREDALESAGSEEALRDSLADIQLSLTTFNEVFLPQQAMITAIRDDLAEGREVETRTARHILVQDEATADEAMSRIEGGDEFGDVAEELSTDPGTAELGGVLPPAPRGQYVPEFDDAAWDAEIGELIGPIETDYGYHVIEVIDEELLASSELEDQQLGLLIGDELNEIVSDAFDSAEITVDPSFGEWDPEDRNVVPRDEVGSGSDSPLAPIPNGDVPDDSEADGQGDEEDGDES